MIQKSKYLLCILISILISCTERQIEGEFVPCKFSPSYFLVNNQGVEGSLNVRLIKYEQYSNFNSIELDSVQSCVIREVSQEDAIFVKGLDYCHDLELRIYNKNDSTIHRFSEFKFDSIISGNLLHFEMKSFIYNGNVINSEVENLILDI